MFAPTTAAMLLALVLGGPSRAQASLDLRLVDVGRYATFADLTSLRWEGRVAQLRLLQVTEDGFMAAREAYWGGWSVVTLDCTARTVTHDGYASIRAGGKEGPLSGKPEVAVVIPPGSIEDAAAKVVCDGWRPYASVPVIHDVEEAVRISRPLIATGAEP
jgi:hypothetical protein